MYDDDYSYLDYEWEDAMGEIFLYMDNPLVNSFPSPKKRGKYEENENAENISEKLQ